MARLYAMVRRLTDIHLLTTAILASTVLAIPAQAEDTADPLRAIEDKAGLPRVLLIGDSISIGYTLPVRETFRGKANVHRPPTNCSATIHGLRDLDLWLGSAPWDVIHFNWGLHDLKYIDAQWKIIDPGKGRQATMESEYAANLRALVRRLRQTNAHLIWCTTTPVPEGYIGRFPDDVVKYNAIAAKVMKQASIDVDDLYSFAKPRLNEVQPARDVHFSDKGSQLLAEEVARSIEKALKQRRAHSATGERR